MEVFILILFIGSLIANVYLLVNYDLVTNGIKIRDLECDLKKFKHELELKEFNSLSEEERENERKEVEKLFNEFGLKGHYKTFTSFCKGVYTAENAREYIKGFGRFKTDNF